MTRKRPPVTMRVGFTGGGNITDTHIRAVQGVPGLQPVGRVRPQRRPRSAPWPRATASSARRRWPRSSTRRRSTSSASARRRACTPTRLRLAALARLSRALREAARRHARARATRRSRPSSAPASRWASSFRTAARPRFARRERRSTAAGSAASLLVDARVKWYRAPEYYRTAAWRGTPSLDGGGALMNQGIHTVDLLLCLLGDVTEVQATRGHRAARTSTWRTRWSRRWTFASGAVGTFRRRRRPGPGYPRRVEITGTEGTLIIEHDRIASWDSEERAVERAPR